MPAGLFCFLEGVRKRLLRHGVHEDGSEIEAKPKGKSEDDPEALESAHTRLRGRRKDLELFFPGDENVDHTYV